jgi:plasmid stabilization system protein ParE
LPVVRPVIFTPPARTELIDAQDWYENEAPGLGRHFRAAVEAVIERMKANPGQFPVIHRNVRRALLHRFPYALMFVVEADETLTVIACFHGSRAPEHWQRRK